MSEDTEQTPTEHPQEAGDRAPDGPATITVQRRWAIGVVGVMAALLLLLATAVVIEADEDEGGPPLTADRGLPYGPGEAGPEGFGFQGPTPPFGGGAPPGFDDQGPPGFDEDQGSRDGGSDQS